MVIKSYLTFKEGFNSHDVHTVMIKYIFIHMYFCLLIFENVIYSST